MRIVLRYTHRDCGSAIEVSLPRPRDEQTLSNMAETVGLSYRPVCPICGGPMLFMTWYPEDV